MADKKFDLWDTVFKIIFSCFLLMSVMSGAFVVGAKTIMDKAVSGIGVYTMAGQLQEDDNSK